MPTSNVRSIIKKVFSLDDAGDLFEIRDAVLSRLREIKAYDDGEDVYDVDETDDDLEDLLGDEEEEDEEW